MTRQQVTTAAKLYEINDTLRRLWADDYEAKIEPTRALLRGIPEARRLSVAIEMAKGEEAAGRAMSALRIFAAAVDVIEPRKERPTAARAAEESE